jgi:hypothetical protein
MTGSSIDIIVIPIVTTICLAVWLIMVYYSDSHPDTCQPRSRARLRAADGYAAQTGKWRGDGDGRRD